MVLNVINQNNTTKKPLNQNRMKALKWLKWFFDFDRENEELNKDAKYQIAQMGKEPHVIEWFAMMEKRGFFPT